MYLVCRLLLDATVARRDLASFPTRRSSDLAAVAGMCLALSYTLAPVQIYAWMGVVFAGVMIGGLGSALGPLLAGLLIGVSEALTMAVTAPKIGRAHV